MYEPRHLVNYFSRVGGCRGMCGVGSGGGGWVVCVCVGRVFGSGGVECVGAHVQDGVLWAWRGWKVMLRVDLRMCGVGVLAFY